MLCGWKENGPRSVPCQRQGGCSRYRAHLVAVPCVCRVHMVRQPAHAYTRTGQSREGKEKWGRENWD